MIEILKTLKDKYRSSSCFLIAANTVPLVGIIFFKWGVMDIFLVYLLETAVIGFYNILKMITVEVKDNRWGIPDIFLKIYFIFLFVVNFAGGTFVFGAMIYLVVVLFAKIEPDIPKILITAWPAILSLLISHGYSFIKNYYLGEERKKATLQILMIQPFVRLMGLFAILFIGAMVDMVLIIKYRVDAELYFLILFIVLKIIIDLIGHAMERKKFSVAQKISNGMDSMSNLGEKITGFINKRFFNKK